MLQASSNFGCDIAYRDDTEDLLTTAGFVDISHRTVRIPLQANPRDERDASLKRYFQSFMSWPDDDDGGIPQSFEALSLSLFSRELRMPADEIRAMCNSLRHIYASDRWPLYHNL